LSRKLEKWYELDWLGFKKELEKSKIKLTLPQQKQWKDFFKDEQPQAITLFFDIEKLDKEIDDLVYQLYNLTTEEIAWIENDN
jgi:superfamily I DNA and RNA helicase